MSEENKAIELNDEDLEKVSGGGSYSQNEDGSYNINYGEHFTHHGCYTFTVLEDVRNAQLWSKVYCEWCVEDSEGNLLQNDCKYCQVKEILFGYGYL